jgi:hypothetical protein
MKPNSIGPITFPSGLLVFIAPTIPPLCSEVVEDATASLRIGMKRESPIPKTPTKRKTKRMEGENGINAMEMAAMANVSLTAVSLET